MSEATGSPSRRTIFVAMTANVLIAAAKGVAGLLTGSSALLAEAGHSVADIGNELFLLLGLRSSRRPADATHPFGYGAERFYWSLLAAVGIFVAGGLTAIWQGVRQLQHPHSLDEVGVGYAVLAVSLVLDGTSWRTAYRQLRGEAREYRLSLRRYLRGSSDPTVPTVFFEDTAGVIGIVFAVLGLALNQITGSAVPDAGASVAIGLLLILVALRLARRERELLTNHSAPPRIVDEVRHRLLDDPAVRYVPRLEVLTIGPRTWLVTAEVALDSSSHAVLTDLVGQLRRRVCTQPGVAAVYLTLVADPPRS